MTQQHVLELAKQGNPKAIATLMNQALKPKGITVKATLKDRCLHVVLDSLRIPDQHTLRSFVSRGVMQLGLEDVRTVRVYGRQTGKEFSTWIEEFRLGPDTDFHPLEALVDYPMASQAEPLPVPAPAKSETVPNYLPKITRAEVKRLGTYLVEAGLLTEAQIKVALADQKATGVRFGEILVSRGWLKQQTIEYLMEKIISPERESAKRASSLDSESPQKESVKQSLHHPAVPSELLKKQLQASFNERETLIIDDFSALHTKE